MGEGWLGGAARSPDLMMRVLRGGVRGHLLRRVEVFGEGRVPARGGVVLAANLQSLLDPFLLASLSPRPVRLVLAMEDWPVWAQGMLGLLGALPWEGGGFDFLVGALRRGETVLAFPEGAVPGTRDVPRTLLEARTGLLRGSARPLALAEEAGVPLVPVGVSGTSRVVPPESGWRLGCLPWAELSGVTVRFGDEVAGGLEEMMMAMADMVDHHRSFVPIARRRGGVREDHGGLAPLGVLLLHGFASAPRAIERLVPLLEAQGLPWRLPLLRGHGTRYQDLVGVTDRHWVGDAKAAMLDLLGEAERVAVVGLDMGALLGLELAMTYPERVDGVVALAPALGLRGLGLRGLSPFWPSPLGFRDPDCALGNGDYPLFATDAFACLRRYSRWMEGRLVEVRQPLLVIHSRKDGVVPAAGARRLLARVSSLERELVWFERSGHQMLQDLEAREVGLLVEEFLLRRLALLRGGSNHS